MELGVRAEILHLSLSLNLDLILNINLNLKLNLNSYRSALFSVNPKVEPILIVDLTLMA